MNPIILVYIYKPETSNSLNILLKILTNIIKQQCEVNINPPIKFEFISYEEQEKPGTIENHRIYSTETYLSGISNENSFDIDRIACVLHIGPGRPQYWQKKYYDVPVVWYHDQKIGQTINGIDYVNINDIDSITKVIRLIQSYSLKWLKSPSKRKKLIRMSIRKTLQLRPNIVIQKNEVTQSEGYRKHDSIFGSEQILFFNPKTSRQSWFKDDNKEWERLYGKVKWTEHKFPLAGKTRTYFNNPIEVRTLALVRYSDTSSGVQRYIQANKNCIDKKYILCYYFLFLGNRECGFPRCLDLGFPNRFLIQPRRKTMSSDDAIYILITRDRRKDAIPGEREYRVLLTSAIENMCYQPDYPPSRPVINRERTLEMFGKLPVIRDLTSAVLKAKRMEGVLEWPLEYGIKVLDFSEIFFPASNARLKRRNKGVMRRNTAKMPAGKPRNHRPQDRRATV